MRIVRTVCLAFFLIVSNPFYVLAEEMPPPPRTRDTKPPPPTKVPINEGISFLIASGLILGITIIYRDKTKKASI
ncbi:MAG: hypothetical protein RRY99_07040 [Flavobacterium sp.]